jgi:hypothetical protein
MHSFAAFKRRGIRSLALTLLTAAPAFAGSASDGGTESALILTGVLTIILVALAIFALILPEDDLTRLGASLSGLRRYLVSGKVEKVEMFDHEFDGIRELDNRIPPWFSTLFLATVVFGGIYMLDYHVFTSSPLSGEEYREEIVRADLQRRIVMATEGNIDENTLIALTDPAAIERGGREFAKFCISCHGNKGQGLLDPRGWHPQRLLHHQTGGPCQGDDQLAAGLHTKADPGNCQLCSLAARHQSPGGEEA